MNDKLFPLIIVDDKKANKKEWLTTLYIMIISSQAPSLYRAIHADTGVFL